METRKTLEKGITCNKSCMITCLSFLTIVHLCMIQNLFMLPGRDSISSLANSSLANSSLANSSLANSSLPISSSPTSSAPVSSNQKWFTPFVNSSLANSSLPVSSLSTSSPPTSSPTTSSPTTSSPTTASPPFSDEWVVLLTTTRKRKDPESTKSHELLYMKQIAQWASKSTLPIFVIESSGIGFPELEEKEYPNLHVIPKDIHYNGTSSSIGEALSLIEAAKKMDEYKEIMSGKNYIMKVTGRYYFEGAKEVIDKLTIGKDFYVQRHFNDVITWQNTEYLGIKKELLPELGNKVIEDRSFMEHTFYDFTRDADKSFEYFGRGFKNDQPRGGDKMVINPIR